MAMALTGSRAVTRLAAEVGPSDNTGVFRDASAMSGEIEPMFSVHDNINYYYYGIMSSYSNTVLFLINL